MGDIAEMMLDGTLDAVTGEYLGEPCGYPVSSEWEKDSNWVATKSELDKLRQLAYEVIKKLESKTRIELSPKSRNKLTMKIANTFNSFR